MLVLPPAVHLPSPLLLLLLQQVQAWSLLPMMPMMLMLPSLLGWHLRELPEVSQVLYCCWLHLWWPLLELGTPARWDNKTLQCWPYCVNGKHVCQPGKAAGLQYSTVQ
jgi:hypothetical protein